MAATVAGPNRLRMDRWRGWVKRSGASEAMPVKRRCCRAAPRTGRAQLVRSRTWSRGRPAARPRQGTASRRHALTPDEQRQAQPVGDLELAEHRGEMGLHRRFGDAEAPGNFLVVRSRAHE